VAFQDVLTEAGRAEPRAVPPKINPARTPVFFAVITLAAAALGSGAVLFFFDPSRHGFYPICLFHALTGWNCPGCGGTRAAFELLHGHWLRALHDNALLILALPVAAVWGGGRLVQHLRHRPVTWAVPAWAVGGALTVILLFTVLRNLPAFAWLSP